MVAMKAPKKTKRRHSTEPVEMPQMPLDDALRVLLGSPAKHRKAKKKPVKP